MKFLPRPLISRRRPLLLAFLLSLFVGCHLDMPTLGGRQFWADVAWSDGWRVQRHVWTGHCRLLDPEETRRAWGDESFCVDRLPPQDAERLVVLLHGLGRTRFSMEAMAEELEAEGRAVVALSYPSTRGSIDEHASHVEALLNRLESVREVSFVTHSLGGRIVLRLVERNGEWMDRMALGRVVQIAPPNRGSSLARRLAHVPGVPTLMGPAFLEVRGAARERPPTQLPVGVIAGTLGAPFGYNPLLAGPNDGVVTLAETRPGFPHELLVMEGAHTFLMASESAFTAVRHFLDEGSFEVTGPGARFPGIEIDSVPEPRSEECSPR